MGKLKEKLTSFISSPAPVKVDDKNRFYYSVEYYFF
jgi:hypothetical protein